MDYIALFEKHLTGGRRAGRQWQFNCPRCDIGAHSNGHHLWVNPVTGQWRCFLCESNPDGRGKGNAKTFARMVGEKNFSPLTPTRVKERPDYFEQETATKVYTWLVENAGLVDRHREHLLEKRGIQDPERYKLCSTDGMSDRLRKMFTRDELLASGVFFADDDTGRLVMHESIYSDRIIIPYVRGDAVDYLRSKNMGGGGTRPYLGPIGAGTNQRFWGKVDPNRPYDLIVTEGEFKAIAADQHDFHIIAQPGMNSARDAVAKAIAEANLVEVTICYDSQLKKPENIDGAAMALARAIHMKSRSTRVFRAALPLLPEVDRGSKMDIDSHIVHCGVESFREVIFSAHEMNPRHRLRKMA